MSINLDPKDQTPNIGRLDPNSNAKIKPNLFQKWLEYTYEGHQMEVLPCDIYCLRKWKQIEEGKTTQVFQKWMEDCTKDCQDFKHLAAFFRRI